jgi:putative phosphoribosyl transferase
MRLRERVAADSAAPVQGAADDPPVREEDVPIATDNVELAGYLAIPDSAGRVIFAHGSGSGRNSPRTAHAHDWLVAQLAPSPAGPGTGRDRSL